MLLVVFGAGASYDSVHHLPPPGSPGFLGQFELYRPPLASQLFENRAWFVPLMTQCGDFRSLVPSLRVASSVERRLAEIQQEAETIDNRHCQLASIRYYLHSLFWEIERQWTLQHGGITNHAAFLEAIELWRRPRCEQVCIVTFNYDRMIEQAMTQVLGHASESFSQYISDDHYKLIKLHGSIDWGREVEGITPHTASEFVRRAASLKLSEEYRKVIQPPAVLEGNMAGFPALAIPVERKSSFVCPPEHLEALGNLISRVTKIIAIGWRASEQHFLEMLRKPLTGLCGDVDLMVVSGDQKGMIETTNNLAISPSSTPRKRALREDGFTGLIKNIGHLEAFLR
jgi:hypothetical protein